MKQCKSYPQWPFLSPPEFGNAEHIAHIRNIEGRTIDGETYIEVEFEFLDKNGKATLELNNAVKMAASFDCCNCGKQVVFSKKYRPVPLHYDSIIATCPSVQCSCGAVWRHEQEGQDMAVAENLFKKCI